MKIILIIALILVASCTIYWDVPSTKTTVSPAPNSMKPLYCEDRPSRCPYGN